MPSKTDPSMNVDLNGIFVDGEKKPWGEAFTRLSDEAMLEVRERREAARAEEEATQS